MAARFRRSVKIAPGVKVNFSKRGVSASIGPKGFTHTVGKGGLFRNVSIPGTGVSSRTKVFGGGKKRYKKTTKRKAATRRRTTSASASCEPQIPAAVREWMAYTGERNPKVSIDLALDGTITLFDSRDREITDAQLIGIIKRTPMYKDQLPALREDHRAEVAEKVEEINAENDEFIKIYQYSPQVLDRQSYVEALEGLELDRCDPEPYSVMPPTPDNVRKALLEEAKREVKGSIFKRGQLRQAYVDERFDERFASETKAWEYARQEFDSEEAARVAEINAGYQEEYDAVRLSFERALKGDAEYVEEAAEEWIAGIDLPVEIFTQFEYRTDDHCLMVDLDLPEIEDLPTEIASQLANGDLRIKNKTQKQLRLEYTECVFGLAVYVAANLFNTSPEIAEVVVSGYTQRRDKAGAVSDDYIYSVRLPRARFYGLNYEAMDPEEFCLSCDIRCNVTQTKMFKAIEPYQ